MEERLIDPHELPPVLQTPLMRVLPYARVREQALRGERAEFFDRAVLGFEPSSLMQEGETVRFAVVEGTLLALLDTDDEELLAKNLAEVAAPLFKETHCRVLVGAVRASRLERLLGEAFTRCGAERRSTVERPGDRRETEVVPAQYEGVYPERPFRFAARIITTLRDLLENATLTGEESADNALGSCAAILAVQSDPPGLRGTPHPDVLGVGIAFSF